MSKQPQSGPSVSTASTILENGYCTICQHHHRPELTREEVVDGSGITVQQDVLRHVGTCPLESPSVVPLILHGAAGMGDQSRLKGRAKMGGNSIPERHMQSATVAKTNEFMTSQVCPYCFGLVRLARAKRTNHKGVSRLVRVHGAVECCNPDCRSYLCGHAHRARDSNAALNIALAGYSLLISPTGQALQPFNSKTRHRLQPLLNTSSPATGQTTKSDTTALGA